MDHDDYYTCGSNLSTPSSLKATVVELQETEKLVDVTKSPSVYDSTPTTLTPNSPPHQFTSRELTIALFSAAAGNCMEWYNFSLFGLLASEFGELFYPKSTPTVHLMQAFAVFAVAYFVRPLGGSIFGYIGDRYGSVFTLKLSISIMAVTTLIIAFLPTYHDIGISATIIMISIRVIQGLSAGAEYPAALIYICEICPPDRRSTFAILCQISGLGGILASLFITVLYASFTPTQILNFYWRTPFVFGGIIGLLGLWSRNQLNHDSPTTNTDDTVVSTQNPVVHALRTCKWRMTAIILHCTLAHSQSYILTQWLPSYFTVIAGYKFNAFGINIIAYLLVSSAGLLSAHLIDTFKNMTSSKILIIFGPIQVILNMVLFQYLDDPDDELMAIVIWLICATSYGLYFGAALGIWFMDILPDSSCKQSAFGIAYNIGTFWGGIASLMATFVESHYGGIGAVGWMILVLGCVGIGTDIIASRFMHKPNLKTIR